MRRISRNRGGQVFPPPEAMQPDAFGLVALGGDLREATLLEAYRKGIFPWEGREPIPWYSPDPRMILAPGAFHAGRSLRKAARRAGFEITVDHAFVPVMSACARVPRRGQVDSWITPRMIRAYGHLHDRGVAHSVEVWQGEALVGGLYGLALGRAFFGESMFSRAPNASKVGLWTLCALLAGAGYHFVDCQQETAHLRSLGAVAIPRGDYLARLAEALAEPDGWLDAIGDPEAVFAPGGGASQ